MRYSEHICARYQQALNLLSRRWVGLIVRVLLDGPLRFNELAGKLQVVADRVLAERLRDLEAEGVVTRAVHVGSPVRVEYALTAKGLALAPCSTPSKPGRMSGFPWSVSLRLRRRQPAPMTAPAPTRAISPPSMRRL